MDKVIIGNATFILGDCLDVMKNLSDNSIDTIITDPPYGLFFMGKKWDYNVPSVEIWRECLRILKPGGTALIFAGSRTQHRMAINVEDAGFILKDCIMWLYGSGFPKATDISKQIDKRARRDYVIEAKKLGVLPKDANRSFIDWTKEGHSPSDKYWKEFKKVISREDWEKIERIIVGKNNHSNSKHHFTVGENHKQRVYLDVTSPSTPEAKLWDGWKSHGLKPAYEPILVAVKPNEGSYAENAINYGVAGLNIDGGRVESGQDYQNTARENPHKSGGVTSFKSDKNKEGFKPADGRYPANVILDEEAAAMLDEQSGELISGSRNTKVSRESENNCMSGKNYQRELPILTGSTGGASRFFYCAKASPAERNAGCDGLPLNEPNYGKNMSSSGKGTVSGSVNQTRNNHPTVKPISLMEYLCNLTKTPMGGTVLDLFGGSGSTILAAYRADRKSIYIEKEKGYFDIAVARYLSEIKQLRLCDQ